MIKDALEKLDHLLYDLTISAGAADYTSGNQAETDIQATENAIRDLFRELESRHLFLVEFDNGIEYDGYDHWISGVFFSQDEAFEFGSNEGGVTKFTVTEWVCGREGMIKVVRYWKTHGNQHVSSKWEIREEKVEK